MKFLRNVFIGLLLLYAFLWLGLAIYFSCLDYNKSFFEKQLSRHFSKEVSIDVLQTTWSGLSPKVNIEGFRVAGIDGAEPPLEFESLTATLDPWSVFLFWPKFSEFSVEKPSVEIEPLNANEISIGGLVLSFKGSSSLLHPKTVVRWLLDQHQTQWSDGRILLRRPSGESIEYTDISFVFNRKNQARAILAGFTGVDGAVNFKAQSHGDLLSTTGWGATLEILDEQGQAFIAQDDLSLVVSNGEGKLKLKRLKVQTIQDFIALSGLSAETSWLTQTTVLGYLHDAELEFSGPLFAVQDWGLVARASDIGFESKGQGPRVNNLAGQVSVSKESGTFLFSTQGSVFEWQDKFEQPFEINSASGQFAWQVNQDGAIEVSLQGGEFDDGIIDLTNLTLTSVIKKSARNINSLGDLFRVDSVADLSFDNDSIVKPESGLISPLSIDASADFTMSSVPEFDRYLPKFKSLALFRKWWSKAYSQGSLSNGRVSYQGQLSRQAITSGKAFFNVNADYSDVAVDYGHPRSWPKVDRAKGKLSIANDLLAITSNDAYMGGDLLTDFNLKIPKLFNKNLQLSLQGRVTKSFKDIVEFIFTGPLIAQKNKPSVLPIRPGGGSVDLDMSVIVPLNKVSTTQVKGSAVFNNAVAYLPGDVPINIANSTLNFTEKSVRATQIKARFLGGDVNADIVTVEQAQPPVFKVNAKGFGVLTHLKPWVGGHVLSLANGATAWKGSLLVDGSSLKLNVNSNLDGVTVTAPEPLTKKATESRRLSMLMEFGGSSALSLSYGQSMNVNMSANGTAGSLFDRALISVSNDQSLTPSLNHSSLADGVNVDISRDDINLDQLISSIIELSEYEPENQNVDTLGSSLPNSKSLSENLSGNNDFVDAMRSISINANNPVLIGRALGKLDLALSSPDGAFWKGNVAGANVAGAMELKPFENDYSLNLSRLVLNDRLQTTGEVDAIDYSLSSGNYPAVSAVIDALEISKKKFGRLELQAAPIDEKWTLTKFEMSRGGVKTLATGHWLNDKKLGSMTSFNFETKIEQADSALDDFSLEGFIKKGSGSISGNINWIGAPHEFEYSRLNGDFNVQLVDGELLKVEPGGGKLLGLFNSNAVVRRLSLDFRDVFADGLIFDRMEYKGLFSDGKAIMRDAFIFAPAAFIRMEGQVDIAQESIDMEIHMSPELGGNIALLSALANPAAGAIVFLTQRIFKDQIRDNNFTSYRALGTWEEFEIEPFKINDELKKDEPKVKEQEVVSPDAKVENKDP